MFRTVTSDVSAVSCFVANSRQSMQYGSSSLSKIPYVGFSPVRLQTGIQPRPSPVRTGLSARSAFTHPLPTYTWPKLLVQRGVSPQHCWFFRSRDLSSSGTPFNIANSTPVQRPLARQWVMLSHQVIAYYGLIRNSRPSHRFIYYYDGSSPYDLVWTGSERLPNLLRVSFPPCRLPYPGGPNGCL